MLIGRVQEGVAGGGGGDVGRVAFDLKSEGGSAVCGHRSRRSFSAVARVRAGAGADDGNGRVVGVVAALVGANVAWETQVVAKEARGRAVRAQVAVAVRGQSFGFARAVVGTLNEKRAGVVLRRRRVRRTLTRAPTVYRPRPSP